MRAKTEASKKEKRYKPSLFISNVSCGFPSPADDYIDAPLDLNELLITKPAATFFVKAKGDSMIGAGIFDGDILIIDRSKTPRSGNVILAVLDGEFTLKSLHKARGEISLMPQNPKYSSIKINPENEFNVWGVATYCIHKL